MNNFMKTKCLNQVNTITTTIKIIEYLFKKKRNFKLFDEAKKSMTVNYLNCLLNNFINGLHIIICHYHHLVNKNLKIKLK